MEQFDIDNNDLKIVYETARLKYKPSEIRFLLISEAPPDDINRFFYFEDVPEKDFLFCGIMKALYPELEEAFIRKGRKAEDKSLLLRKFQSEGFYLLDTSEIPLIFQDVKLDALIPDLVDRIISAINDRTRIILIKTNVYELLFEPLSLLDLNVVNKKIPFPSSGRQTEFHNGFIEVLKIVGYLSK